ncbi:unnamed protein product [Allacma fusca]|uniref:Carboxylesterase type B domain-containing protein n=1 Tax=Allacma fusca TaxID=39272 RepID=A0A8J2LAL7_9HEXA|nr:unnamed protein product [Allacma fusca]
MSTFHGLLAIAYFVAQVSSSWSATSQEEMKSQHRDEKKEKKICNPQESLDVNSIVPIVKCPAGTFRGSLRFTRSGRHYFEFQSIPYAEPPNRFEVAIPKARIKDEYDATTEPPVCPQILDAQKEFVGQEDCLYLSVSKPDESECRNELSNGKLLPVLFWIHPGDYNHGNGSFYKGTYLLDACVVLVTINYRVGALGHGRIMDKLHENRETLWKSHRKDSVEQDQSPGTCVQASF